MPEPKKKQMKGEKPATTPKKPVAKKTQSKPETSKKITSVKPTPTTNKSSTVKKTTSSTRKTAESKKTSSKQTTSRKKKTTRAKKPTRANQLKIPKAELTKFPYEMFPVKLFHMEGNDFTDLKICSFTDECYALKYIERLGLKKSEYKMVKKK